MKKLFDKSINIMFNKMNNFIKLNKHTEKEIIEILFKDIEFVNAFIVICIHFAIRYEINKTLKEY